MLPPIRTQERRSNKQKNHKNYVGVLNAIKGARKEADVMTHGRERQ